jgi:hypothetical protein
VEIPNDVATFKFVLRGCQCPSPPAPDCPTSRRRRSATTPGRRIRPVGRSRSPSASDVAPPSEGACRPPSLAKQRLSRGFRSLGLSPLFRQTHLRGASAGAVFRAYMQLRTYGRTSKVAALCKSTLRVVLVNPYLKLIREGSQTLSTNDKRLTFGHVCTRVQILLQVIVSPYRLSVRDTINFGISRCSTD